MINISIFIYLDIILEGVEGDERTKRNLLNYMSKDYGSVITEELIDEYLKWKVNNDSD